MRYGVRRTTMSEIAVAAKVSRPTLYGHFASKEELLGGVIECHNDQMIETISRELETRESLAAKLDAVFDHAVLRVFDLMQSWPDASDIVTEDNQNAMDAYLRGLKRLEAVIERILLPHASAIEASGQTVRQYSEFVVFTATRLKKNLRSRDQLRALLTSLKASVLCVAGVQQQTMVPDT
ncbi:MAG: TetR/AcrR family transcriptional regulator [Rhodobacteraceae bacterium]|nr:TetR/AcrR family transcriptional regulator [Paracoccaceae bacterium]